MTHVIDASALLAVILDEAGAAEVLIPGRSLHLSIVNLGEVFTKVVERGGEVQDVRDAVAKLPIRIRSFREADAAAVARLRLLTRHRGLSFGDRACLALAQRIDLPVLAADKHWSDLAIDCDIRLIR